MLLNQFNKGNGNKTDLIRLITMAASKIITPIISCWLAISEASVGFISIRVETSRQ